MSGAILDHLPKNSLGFDKLALGHGRNVEFVFVPLGLDDDSRAKPLERYQKVCLDFLWIKRRDRDATFFFWQ